MADQPQLGLLRIERETVQERVYSALRDRLMRGGFEPGQKLKIAELASAFGTSAMPVREALNRLAAERAVECMPNRSVRVPALSKAALQDLMETRFAVEGLAVARAASNMTDETLMRLRQLIDAQSETDAVHVSEGSAEQNRAFHFTIYRQSGSTVLLPIIESLWLQFGRNGLTVAKVAAPTFTSKLWMHLPVAMARPRARRWNPILAGHSIW